MSDTKKISEKFGGWSIKVLIIVACMLLYALFISPSVKLDDRYKPDFSALPDNLKDSIITEQVKKTNSEINTRLDHESRWYELKFVFLGVIILGFFAKAVLKTKIGWDRKEEHPTESEKRGHALLNILISPITLTVLTIAFVVSLSIDLHIRANRIVINQNGIWVAEFAEPLFLRNHELIKSCEEKPKESCKKIMRGWEQFLRIGGLSHHTDFLYRATFWPHVYYITILIYGLYLSVLAWILDPGKTDSEETKKINDLRTFSFWLVHITLFVCAFSAHYVPDIYDIVLWGIDMPNWSVFLVYPVVVGLVTVVSFFGILRRNLTRKE